LKRIAWEASVQTRTVLVCLLCSLVGCGSGAAEQADEVEPSGGAGLDAPGLLADGSVPKADGSGPKTDGPRPGADAASRDAQADARSPVGVPLVDVGYDAYRHFDRLPYLKFGVRAFMRSTYDRSGGNEGADASHFLRQEAPDRNVTLDVAGPGVFTFFRANHWHGSPWQFTVDGALHTVSESSTATPNSPAANAVFLPAGLVPEPLGYTWATTKGADLMWRPIPFAQGLELAYGRTHYGTGYYIYQSYEDGGANLSQKPTWDPAAPPPDDVLTLLASAGEDIGPTGSGVETVEGSLDVPATDAVTVATLTGGPKVVRVLRLTVPENVAIAAGKTRLRITWDDRKSSSIDAPLALFFGAGTLYNRSSRDFLVKGLLVNVARTVGEVALSIYHPMPFRSSARIELLGAPQAIASVGYHIRTVPYTEPLNWVGYLHATYKDHGTPVRGKDLVLLDTTQTEGGGDFCGSFVGTSFIFSDKADLGTLEGDPRFFFDDAAGPQGYGTGTEEWGGGGDYWGGQNMTLPFVGHPVGASNAGGAADPEDLVESAYRYLVADAMPFGRNARIQLEHGGGNDSTEHYQSVTYWYGYPGACLVPTDHLHVGDAADETAHRYASPTASAVETLTSRYEWGTDDPSFAPITDTGRHMTGTSDFTVTLDPANVGALVRRRLDYAFPDQKAEVLVADDADGATFEHAATWYTAGSNRCIYSNPSGETDAATQTVETSSRRFRDDEILLPRRLTEGRKAVRVRIVYAPLAQAIYPGAAPVAGAWSEYRYDVYSYVLPPL
jgi:hypothetical protein